MFEAILPFMPAIIGLVLAGVGAGLAWVKGKGWLRAQFLDALNTDISAVVNEVYQEYVKARKAASEDGTLTEEEKKEARNLALKKLKELGKAKGKDYAKEHLVPVVMDLIEKWVSKKKSSEDNKPEETK